MAMEDRRITHITYRSLRATEPTTYDIYPLGMIHHRGSLYLVGWVPRRERVQHWKIDRIEDVEVTPLQFQRPEDFDLHQHLAKSFGIFHGEGDVQVKVRFSPATARCVQEGRWHGSQKLTREKDGSLLAEFRLSTTEEVKRWVLSFGKEAEVLEPERLRMQILHEAQTVASFYGRASVPQQQRSRKKGIRQGMTWLASIAHSRCSQETIHSPGNGRSTSF